MVVRMDDVDIRQARFNSPKLNLILRLLAKALNNHSVCLARLEAALDLNTGMEQILAFVLFVMTADCFGSYLQALKII